jgi:hypothetical protein
MAQLEFYFYENLDDQFLKVVNEVRSNSEESGKKIFAKIMYVTKDGKNDVVVFASKSDDEDSNGNRKYSEDKDKRRREVRGQNLMKVYSLPSEQVEDARYDYITYRDVFNGTISVEPLNLYLKGRKVLSNFKDLRELNECTTLDCIKSKTKCDKFENVYVDDEIKFSRDSDKPHTRIFCRRYGSVEIADEINEIDDYDKFVKRLEEEYKINVINATDVEEKLRGAGRERIKQFIAKYRLPLFQLSDADLSTANELAGDRYKESYVLFSERLRKLLLSSNEQQRISGENMKNYLKYQGPSEIKQHINILEAEITNLYIQERERKLTLSKEEFSFSQMTFSIGQKVVETVSRGIRNIKQIPVRKIAGDIGRSISAQKKRMEELLSQRRDNKDGKLRV